MSLRKEFNGENVDIEVLAALTHLNEMIELKDGTTWLEMAQQTERKVKLDQLYQTAKTYHRSPSEINKIDPALTEKQQGLSLLFWAIACSQNAKEISSHIKHNNECVNEVYFIDGKEIKPLFYAMSIGHLEAITAMVTASPSLIYQENELGLTLAHAATLADNTRVLEALYTANPEAIRVCNRTKQTALHLAAQQRLVNTARWLVVHDKHEMNELGLVNMCDINGRSPLVSVIDKEHPIDEITIAMINDVLLISGANCLLRTNANDPNPNLSALQLMHARCEGLRFLHKMLKDQETDSAKSAPSYRPSKELVDIAHRLEKADYILSCFISHITTPSIEFQVASDLLHYIARRELEPEHITDNSILGKLTFVSNLFSAVAKAADNMGTPILYNKDQKIGACRQLLANIINGDPNPFAQLPEAQQKILEQRSLAAIIAPLKATPELSAQHQAERSGLGSSH